MRTRLPPEEPSNAERDRAACRSAGVLAAACPRRDAIAGDVRAAKERWWRSEDGISGSATARWHRAEPQESQVVDGGSSPSTAAPCCAGPQRRVRASSSASHAYQMLREAGREWPSVARGVVPDGGIPRRRALQRYRAAVARGRQAARPLRKTGAAARRSAGGRSLRARLIHRKAKHNGTSNAVSNTSHLRPWYHDDIDAEECLDYLRVAAVEGAQPTR